MGNASNRTGATPPQDPKAFFQADLPKFIIQSRIGNGKFMKTYSMRVDGVPLAVKVYLRSPEDDQILQQFIIKLTNHWKTLSPAKYPNLLPYECWMKSSSRFKGNLSPVYLIRQYLNANLYDRLSTRPFLHEFEKLWISLQLMKCLEICHGHRIVHGDVKPENVMCTTWNWVVLTDFAPFKPASIPDDDPTDYQYFFDTMGRRRCSVAPERFIRKSNNAKTDETVNESREKNRTTSMTTAMDVFSLGCTIAEIFLDGDPLLDLPAMLKYVSSNFDKLDHEDSPVKTSIQRISNSLVRKVIVDMTQRDPERRLSVKDYRLLLQSGITTADINAPYHQVHERKKPVESAFPPYFDSLLHPLFTRIHYKGVTPDERISILCDSYGDLIRSITGVDDEPGQLFFSSSLIGIIHGDMSDNDLGKDSMVLQIRKNSLDMARNRGSLVGLTQDIRELLAASPDVLLRRASSASSTTKGGNITDHLPSLDKKAQTIEELLEKCRNFMSEVESKYNDKLDRDGIEESIAGTNILDAALRLSSEGEIISSPFLHTWGNGNNERDICNALVIIVQLIVSHYRSLKYSQTRIISLLLLVRLGLRCSDDIIVQRIVPIVVFATDDSSPYVRSIAIRSLRALLKPVRSVSTFESSIFTNYIFPSLTKLLKDPEIIVRVAFAESLGVIAEASKRFLDHAHMVVQNKVIADAQVKDGSNSISTSMSSVVFVEGIPNDLSSRRSTQTSTGLVDGVVDTSSMSGETLLVDFSYDAKLKALHDQVSRWIGDLVFESAVENRRGPGLSSYGSLVKRALLVDVMRLCVFFGQETTVDALLTQLLTFLSDSDWELRYAFFSKIASVCTFLGRTVTSECVLPCMDNVLFDVEEKVIARAIKFFNVLVQTSLLSTMSSVDLIENVVPLLLHPSTTIRDSSIQLIASIANQLGDTYASVFLLPKLWPTFVRHNLVGVKLTVDTLKLSLQLPINRRAFRQALLQRLAATPPSGGDLSMSFTIISPNVTGSNFDTKVFERKTEMTFGVGVSMIDTLDMSNISQNTLMNAVNLGDPKLKSRLEAKAKEILQADSDAELRKLNSISKYLDRASQEMSVKFKLTGGMSTASGALTLSKPSTNMNFLLSSGSNSVSDHAVQSLFAPHQKYGVGYFLNFIEEGRQNMINDLDRVKSANRLRSLFGLLTKPSDVFRAQASADTNTSSESSQAPSLPASHDSNDVGKPSLAHATSYTGGNNSSPLPAQLVPPSSKLSSSLEMTTLLKRIRALGIPPLPPDVGSLLQPNERKYNCFVDSLDISVSGDSQNKSWRPKENILAASLIEHSNAVNRLTVSADQTFFVSASADRTAKIWQIRGIDRVAFPRSSATYSKHKGSILDVCHIENSHTVATASDDGSIHVWRVDLASSSIPETSANAAGDLDPAGGHGSVRSPGLSVSGYSVIKTLDTSEGSVVSVQHYSGEMSSVLVYATQKGAIHGWDMRSTKECFSFPIRPELGYVTCTTISSDRNWICAGTSKGYIALWDIRYNVMSKLWQHSSCGPIYRLASSRHMPMKGNGGSCEGSYLLVAAGNNETAIWDLPEGNECLKCFRAVPKKVDEDLESHFLPLPILRSIPFVSHPLAPIATYSGSSRPSRMEASTSNHTIRTFIGRVSQTTEAHLITGGTDRQIRFWDFISPMKSYSISGLELSQQKPIFEAPESYQGRLVVSYDSDVPHNDNILPAQLPVREGRGPLPPSNSFKDAITDLKTIDLPMKFLISASRDGVIKLWR